MQYKIIDERPWQILSNAMTIGPSSTGYQLQVAADGRNYTTLFTVGAGITRQITNLSSGSYFRMKGNVGEVTVNWVRDCSGGGGGEGGNAGELEPVNEFPVDAPAGTVVALSSGNTVGVYQYDGTDWVPVAGGDMSNYYTKQETDSHITAATSPIQTQLDDVERVTATALTELHNSILELSGATGDFATEDYVDQAITAVTQGTYTTGNTFTKTGKYNQKSFYYLDPLGYDAPEFYAPTTSGIPGQVLIAASGTSEDGTSNTPVWTNLATINGSGLTNGGNIVIGVPQDFQDELSMKEEVIASAITQLHDSIPDVSDFVTTGDIADMVTTGDIQNFVTSGDVATQVSAATQNMVESTSVRTIWKGNQAQYDAITTKDPNTFYIITNS